MFALMRMAIRLSTRILGVFIGVLDVVDSILCDFDCIQKVNRNGVLISEPTGKIWTILNMIGDFICHAYTFNGVGVSYTMAREVLSVRKQFEDLQEKYAESDLVQLYTVYTKTGCLPKAEDAHFEPLLRRMINLRCKTTDAKRLTINRTYIHPIFGGRYSEMMLPELIMDPRITIFDTSFMLSSILQS